MNQLTVMLNNNNNNSATTATTNSNAANNNGNHGQQQQQGQTQQQQYFTFGHGQTIQAIQQQSHQGPGMAIQTDPNQQAQLVTYQQQPQPQQGTTIMVGTQAYTTATQPSINQSQQQPGAIQYFIAPTTFPQQQQCQPAQQQLLTTQTTQQPFGLMSNLITPGVSMFPLQSQQTNGTIQLQQSPQLITQNGTTLQQQSQPQPTFLAMTTTNQSTGTIQLAAGANGNNGATGGQLFTQQHLPMGQQQPQQQQFHIIGNGANQSAIQINQNPLHHHQQQQQQQLNPQIITNAAGQQFILNPGLQQQIVNANTPAMMAGTSHLIATNVLNQQQQQPQSQQQQQQQIYQIVLPNGQVIQTVQPTISNGTNNAAATATLISPQQIQFQPQTQHLQQPQQQLQSHHHLLQTQQLTVPIQQQQQQLHQPTFLGPALTLQQSGQPTFIQPQQQHQQQHLVQIGQQHQLIANCNTSNVQYANAGTVRDNSNNYQLANLTGTLQQQQQPQTHQLNSPTLILTTAGPAAVSPSVQNQSILIQTQNTGSSSNLLIPARSISNSTSGSSSSQSSNSNTANNSSTTTAMVVLTQSPIAPPPQPTCVNSSAASAAATNNTGTQSTNSASLLPTSVLDHKSIQPIVTNNKQVTEVVVPTLKRSNVNTNSNSKKKTTQLSSQQNQSAAFTTEMVNNSSSSSLTLTTTKLVENLSENVQKLTNSFRPPSVGENLGDSANRSCNVVTNPKLISECLKNKTGSAATTTKQATTTTTIATMTDGDISKFQNAIDEASKTQLEFSEKISTAPPSPSPSCCSSTGSLRIAIDDDDDDDNDVEDDDEDENEDENEEADNGEREDTEEGSNDKQEGEVRQCEQQTPTIDNTIDCEENTTENDECSTETEIDNDTVNNQTEEEEEQEQVEEINSNEMDVVDDSGEDLQAQPQSNFDFNKPNELSVVNSFEQPKQQQQLNPLVPTPEDKEGYQSSYGGSPCHFTDTEDEEEEEEDEDEEAEVADNLDNGNEIKLVRGKNGLTKAAYNLINNRILGSEDDNATNASIDSSSKNSLISSINEELCLINNAESINDEEDNGSTLDDQNQTNISKIHPSATPSPAASIASSNGIMEPESTTQNLLVSSTKVSNLIEKTINNTTDVRIIDGVNLDEIKDFAKAFKLCRLSLGLTQSQVGHELSALNGPCYSQSAICRFEKLDITPKSAKKIKPVLENWMRDAEKKHRISKLAVCSGSAEMNDSNNNTNEFNDTNSPTAVAKDSNQNEAFFKMNSLDFVMNSLNSSKSLSSEIISSLNISLDPGKKRKRRTSFSHATIDALNNFFEKNQHPTSSEMTQISEILNQDRDVVRVWFCNKRQALRAKKPNNGQSTNSGDISGGDLSQDSNQSQNEYPSTSTALTVQILNNHSNARLGPVLSQVASSFSSTTATNNNLPPKLDNLSHHQTASSIHPQPNHPHFPSLSSSLHHHAGTITFPSYQPTSTIPLSLSSSSSPAPVTTKMVKFSQPNFATATKSSTQRSPNPANSQSSTQSTTTTTTNNTTSIRLYPTVSVTHHGTTPNSQPQPNHHQQLHRIPNGGGILSHSQQPQLANFNQYGKNMTNSTKHKIVKTDLLNHANNKSEVNSAAATTASATGNLLAK